MTVTRRDILDALATGPTWAVTGRGERVEVAGMAGTHALIRHKGGPSIMVPLAKLDRLETTVSA